MNEDKILELIKSDNVKLAIQLCKGQSIDLVKILCKYYDDTCETEYMEFKLLWDIVNLDNYELKYFYDVASGGFYKHSQPYGIRYSGIKYDCQTKEEMIIEFIKLIEDE